MHVMRRSIVLALLAALGGCGAVGAAGGSPSAATTAQASIRFVAGSPEIARLFAPGPNGQCDPDAAKGVAFAVDGVAVTPFLTYGQVANAVAVASGAHRIDVNCVSLQNPNQRLELLGPYVTAPLPAGSTWSFVLAGRVSRGTLQLDAFAEPGGTGGTIVVDHAAPDVAAAYDFGTLAVSSGTYTRLGSVAFSGVDQLPIPNVPVAIQPSPVPLPTNPGVSSAAASTSSGLAVYVGNGTTPLATLPPTPSPAPSPAASASPSPLPGSVAPTPPLPGQPLLVSVLDPFDVANALPFQAESTMAVYLLDPTDATNPFPQLVGVLR